MKSITLRSLIIFATFSFFQNEIYAQVINWNNISEQNKNLLHADVGAEYGITAGLGYHRFISIKNFPLWIGGEFSIPSGNQLGDDFKVRLGAQIKILTVNRFQFSARIQGITRRYQNQSVRLFNFGSDFAGSLGYYRKHWFLGTEAGFDKAIITNFKHSEWFKNNIYDSVQDGWYEPATGGNFHYGLQGGISMKKVDITLKAGKILQQDFESQPLLPFYGQLGLNFRF